MTPLLIASLTGAFVAVALLTGTVVYLVLERQAPGRKRLETVMAGGPSPTAVRTMPTPTGTLATQASPRVERIASFVPKSPAEMNRLRRRLARAGYHSLGATVTYALAELLTPVILGLPPVLLVRWPTGLILGGFAAVIGFLLPSVVLGRLIEKRRLTISNGLPDVLDLLLVCLGAGCSLDQAITKATEELYLVYPALGEELKMLIAETRAGKPRIEAFKNLEARTKNDDIRALVAMLVQTDRFGTSISQALETFAQTSRTKRRQRAEEAAAKIGVKLVFPLVLLLFPALYVVTLGAAVVQIANVFFGQLTQ